MDEKLITHVHAIMPAAASERKKALGDIKWEDVVNTGLETLEKEKKHGHKKQ